VTRHDEVEGRSLHGRQWLAHLEAEPGVQRQRPIVVAGLHEADAGEASRACPLQHVLHQPPADRAVLRRRVDGDRADADHGSGLPEEIAADQTAVQLGHDRVDIVADQQRPEQLEGRLHGREVGREAMPGGDAGECRPTDRRACLDIVGSARSQRGRHRCASRICS
jgi:hypothetical protein